MPSLHRKIRVGFFLYAAVLVLLGWIAYADLRYLDRRIQLADTVNSFVDTVLELRRYEKNYFLYGHPEDAAAVGRYADLADEALTRERDRLLVIASPARLDRLRQRLEEYRQLFSQYRQTAAGEGRGVEVLASEIRAAGRELALAAETLAGDHRTHLTNTLARARTGLWVALAVVVMLGLLIAQGLVWATVRPLRKLERDLDSIGEGRSERLQPASRDREIVSMVNAVNHMLDELELRRRRLMQSEKLASLGTLVSGVAHELNNPLSNISTSSQILQEEVRQGDFQRLETGLGHIDEETGRARNIVRTLLEFSHEQRFDKQPVALFEVVDKALLLLGYPPSKRTNIKVDIDPVLTVEADTQRLQQVFVNLVKNALDAGTAATRVSIRAREEAVEDFVLPEQAVTGRTSRPAATGNSRLVRIEVADNGPGIPAAALSKVFDPFFTTKDVGHGSGLGLYVTQDIVDQHNGCIAVTSEPGRGTCFVICLPRVGGESAS